MFLQLIETFVVAISAYVSGPHPVSRFKPCVHAGSQPYTWVTSPKSFPKKVVSSPLSQVEHLALPPLNKTPPEIQPVTYLIRDEPWKQRAASELYSCSHPLRRKRVGLSCRREQAMTGLYVGGWWPCIMNGAKYASAAAAEWRRWRAMGWCQPIGCPRVMHITSTPTSTLPPLPHSLSTALPRP